MPTTSTHLGLIVAAGGDNFVPADLATNLGILDASPGLFICTSTTRPTTWGANQAGRRIVETDTGLIWRWTGTAFTRQNSTGVVSRSSRTAPLTTTSTWTPGSGQTGTVVVVSAVATVPAGGRWVMLVAEVPQVQSSAGLVVMSMWQDTTQLTWWNVTATNDATASGQGKLAPFITFTTVAGAGATPTFSLRFASSVSFGGTATLGAGANQPISLSVVEV